MSTAKVNAVSIVPRKGGNFMRNRIFSLVMFLIASLPLTVLAQADTPILEELDSGWNVMVTDGVCSPGTPFQFYVNPGPEESQDLMVFFNGGGACWFGQACDLNSQPNIHTPLADMATNLPENSKGIFDTDNVQNPLADYHMVFIPYCTGDVHLGAGPKTYSYENAAGEQVEVTAFHNGFTNSTMVLDWVYANFSTPRNIFVAGSSAGAIGASFYSGLIAEHYDQTPVVMLADAAGGYNTPNLPVTFNAWNTADILPTWEEYAGRDNDNLTFEDFYIASARHNDNLTIGQYNAANDATQIMFTQLIGDPPGSFDLPQRILHNYLKIEDAVDEFHSYTAGGDVHMILQSDLAYSYEVEGVRFIDWLAGLVRGEGVGDVSCVDEPEGCVAAPGQ